MSGFGGPMADYGGYGFGYGPLGLIGTGLLWLFALIGVIALARFLLRTR